MDTTKVENHVEFLWNASSLLKTETHAQRLLKSYYLTRSRDISRNKVNLPIVRYGKGVMCYKCSSPWSDGNFSLSVIPAVKRDRKARKLIELSVAGKYLKKIQKSLALKFKEDVNNRAEIKCLLCKTKTKITLNKPKVQKRLSKQEVLPAEIPKKIKKPKKEIKPIPILQLTNASKKKKMKKFETPAMKKNVSTSQKNNNLIQLANMLKMSASQQNSNSSSDKLKKFLR